MMNNHTAFMLAILLVLISIIIVIIQDDNNTVRRVMNATRNDSGDVKMYPAAINITDKKINYLQAWYGQLKHKRVFFFDEDYLNFLSNRANIDDDNTVTVILGKKDAGKSKGLMFMINQWESVGHLVIDLNLKGEPRHATAGMLMPMVVVTLMGHISTLGSKQYRCLHNYIQTRCHDINQDSTLWAILCGVSVVVTALFPSIVKLGKLERRRNDAWLEIMWNLFCLLDCFGALLVLCWVCLLVIFIMLCYPVFFYETIQPLNVSISSGDWKSLVCSIGGIALCSPERMPILVVREIMNFDEDSLACLLKSLEKAKEGDLHFPVVIETSDFYNFNSTAISKSMTSFYYYELADLNMTYARRMFVDEYRIWSDDEFNEIYDVVGGHVGLWYEMYRNKRLYKDLDKSLVKLRQRFYSPIHKEIIKLGKRDEMCEIFSLLSSNNYSIMVEDNSYLVNIKKVLIDLININILFCGEITITPQSLIVQKDVIDKVCKTCPCKKRIIK